MPRRGGRWIRDGLPGLAVVGILSGTVALLIHRDWVESEERRRAEGEQALASARYSCSPAYSNGHEAVWHLRPK